MGDVYHNKMVLSDFGKINEMEFLKSFEIRDEFILDERIKNYIINNPINWENDKFKPENSL